jgi:hypothetical protein
MAHRRNTSAVTPRRTPANNWPSIPLRPAAVCTAARSVSGYPLQEKPPQPRNSSRQRHVADGKIDGAWDHGGEQQRIGPPIFGAAGSLAKPSKRMSRSNTAAVLPPLWTANSSKALAHREPSRERERKQAPRSRKPRAPSPTKGPKKAIKPQTNLRRPVAMA